MASCCRSGLSARDCYVGQLVHWVMWVNEDDARYRRGALGWWSYQDGLSPELWSGLVAKVSRNGTVMLEHYGKPKNAVYACELHAVNGAYEAFCLSNMAVWPSYRTPCRLGEASRALRLLAQLEYGLHESRTRQEVLHGR